MSDERKDPAKNIDLHESEWRHDKKKEPILGRNGVFFCIMVPLSLVISYLVKWSFTFFEARFGAWPGIAVWALLMIIFIWVLLEPILSAVFGLADYLLQKLRRQ